MRMTQDRVLNILKTGANVFLTGEPGTGKTYVLNRYTAWLEVSRVPVAITASTGIAATHIGGMTIHSWSHIGTRDTLTHYDLDRIAQNEKASRRIRKAKVLVIDEISMLDGRVLDMVDAVCRTVRGNGSAFGGLQVIVVGDFFQLPPISGRGEMSRFAFEANAWERGRFLTCYLAEQHRQEDELLHGLLSAIRKNDIDESHYTLLGEQTDIGYADIEPTRLFTHNSDVDAMNAERLSELTTERRTYTMEGRGNKQLLEGLVRNCLSPQLLDVKREAMVMCTKNNFEQGYVNGTLGRVVSFDPEDGFPVIRTAGERTIKITPATWSVIDANSKPLAEITQVPLRLAWAITIHKSQGMSLDAAEIDLRNAFTYGQGYVALSRVRTLAGMKVLGLNSQALLVDPRVLLRDEKFKIESDDVEFAFGEMREDEIVQMQKNFITACGGIWHEGDVAVYSKAMGDRLTKESTYALTHELVKQRMTADQIAQSRKLALSTVWGHIEKLAEDGTIDHDDVLGLIPRAIPWGDVYRELTNVFEKEGTDRLKPVYEALGERYDYNLIRIGRLLYTRK